MIELFTNVAAVVAAAATVVVTVRASWRKFAPIFLVLIGLLLAPLFRTVNKRVDSVEDKLGDVEKTASNAERLVLDHLGEHGDG